MQHVVSVESSPFLLIVHVLICDFAIYNVTIHFIFNTDWMANTEIVLDPNNIYKMVVVYLFTLMTTLQVRGLSCKPNNRLNVLYHFR